MVDHAGIAAALKEIGFDGVCTIEEFRPEYYAMSHEDNVKKQQKLPEILYRNISDNSFRKVRP